VPASLTPRLAAVPGVRAAIADVAVPASVDGRDAEAHGWAAAVLTPYELTTGRPPARPGEVVTGFRAPVGSRLTMASTEAAREVVVVGTARPRHPVRSRDVLFLTDREASRLAGHPGRVDAIGILAGPGFDAARLRAVAGDAIVLTGAARGQAEAPERAEGRVRLIAVAASFAGLGIFVALFVVASTMALGVQQREQEIALLRAIASTPGQIRRMIAWEATIVALAGSAAGIYPGLRLGRELADGLVRHGIAPPEFTVGDGTLAVAGVLAGSVLVALLAVWSAGRRASRIPPTRALADAAVEPQLLGRGRLVGGLVAIAGAIPLFSVSAATSTPATAAATSQLTAIFLVVAVGCLGPVVARLVARMLQPLLATIAPVGGFLAAANLATATRRFSSASTPIVLTVAMSCTLLFSTTTFDGAIADQRAAGLSGDLALSSAGAGLPPAALDDVRATRGVRSAVGFTPTTLGPSLGVSDDVVPAAVVAGDAGGVLDPGVTAGTLTALHGDAIALSRRRADGAGATVGDRVRIVLGDGTPARATVAAIYTRELAFGEALLSPDLAAGHTTTPLLGAILLATREPEAVAARLRERASAYPGLRVERRAAPAGADDADQETNRWLGPLFVAIVFAFTSIAVVNTLVMIASRRGRELALLRLTGATRRQIRSMARWEAALIVTIGLGVGLAIAAAALLPLSEALTGELRPQVPMDRLAAILGVSTLLAAMALTLPTRRALRTHPLGAMRTGE
jgi:putative ABC transport system permease protein